MGRTKAYSSPCSQTVSLSPAILSRLLRGYRSLMPSCAGFLEPRKSTFNAENFILSLSMSTLIGFGTIRSCTMYLAAQNRQKIHKNPLSWRSRSSKVIELGANQEPVYDFLLVTNSNLGPISHHYWVTATYWPKITNFAYPLSFSALVRGDPLRIYKKTMVPETKVFPTLVVLRRIRARPPAGRWRKPFVKWLWRVVSNITE